ncbi:crotonase/enoyl-CoA hydratase family protein [Sphingomonas carotinifaciens]|uniref:DSF synthase n=1 Tax=Sphingomonas carotinifaciens TaxID=1166323 RepID=A0A1G7MLG7_9SPHN|nr:crotonase/enoyl-CoA hydratase family protein [Sphingomonas carotinifaciens]MBB4086766.1 DSF synthase [Sphingomonas carotinifaciens]MWC42235.1 enoyl-CoA hydratase [Sphingomonas carotinifaciens]SDF62635.1 DSF synthase [Sphingomonas carotinifaciens]
MTIHDPSVAAGLHTRPAADPAPLFRLAQLDVSHDPDLDTLWTYMRPRTRPSFNPDLLGEFARWQDDIVRASVTGAMRIRYLVLGSSFPGIFSLGGDLHLFSQHIRAGDRAALVRYGRACVAILHRNMLGLERPIVTIGLVQGDALGGGFEALLSFNVVIAERGASFGLPETLFGLFPGMGAHCFLSRRLGAARAEQMILSGRTYSAEELYDMGLVHGLAEPGEGRRVVEDYIRHNRRRHSAHCAIYEASRAVNPLTLAELEAVVDLWADAALRLSEGDLKLMRRLIGAQTRLLEKAG